jgi:hypothetical protein
MSQVFKSCAERASMIETPPESLSLAQTLFGDGETHVRLEETLRKRGAVTPTMTALAEVAIGLRTAAAKRLEEQIENIFGVPLGDVLLGGWRKYEELIEAARRSVADPATEELVPLDTHDIVSIHRSRIDITLDGRKVAEVHVELDITIHVEAVVAVVRVGRLVELETGRAMVGASLACGDANLEWPPRDLDLRLAVTLGPGLELVPVQAAAP